MSTDTQAPSPAPEQGPGRRKDPDPTPPAAKEVGNTAPQALNPNDLPRVPDTPAALAPNPEDGTRSPARISRRGLLSGIVGGIVLAAGAGGIYASQNQAPATPGQEPKPQPSEANPPATPEKPAMTPKEMYRAPFEALLPLTPSELHTPKDPRLLPDYLSGKDGTDPGHAEEIPEIFKFHLKPADFPTVEAFGEAVAKEYFDRWNALYRIGTSGRDVDNDSKARPEVSKRVEAAEAAFAAMYGPGRAMREEGSLTVIRQVMNAQNTSTFYAQNGPDKPAFPAAYAMLPDMDSLKVGRDSKGQIFMTIDSRTVWKADPLIMQKVFGLVDAQKVANVDQYFTQKITIIRNLYGGFFVASESTPKEVA